MNKLKICYRLFFLLVAVLIGLSAYADELETNNIPEHVPTSITASFAGDPSSGFSVTWRTQKPVSRPVAQIAPASAGPSFTDKVGTAKITGRSDAPGGGYAYQAHFSKLSAGTAYVYRVGDGITFSEWFEIRTAGSHSEPFRFIYLGDEQNFLKEKWSRSVRAAFMHAPDARFICHAGDLVAEGYDPELWRQWSYAMGFIAASDPGLLQGLRIHSVNLAIS